MQLCALAKGTALVCLTLSRDLPDVTLAGCSSTSHSYGRITPWLLSYRYRVPSFTYYSGGIPSGIRFAQHRGSRLLQIH
ncbi:uncharacterized protein EDB93DRAFT_1176445 [Suillus bovinus]|uniref:uncharacterized protein n=1 Tax=Suillus bovinus TaxID=48563 RepID=UPI001B885D5D|nr:uncharacterized protein EDB93DRAFT_1176445 [Suillus bovinus]KAG2132510.1 hypothetical protein EDB93DRAFT_1176445 [Suillus bovinus]